MKTKIMLYWIMVIFVLGAGCVSTMPTIQITQGYEKKLNMDETEAIQVLNRFLSSLRPPFNSSPAPDDPLYYALHPNIHPIHSLGDSTPIHAPITHIIFGSIDKNGYVCEVMSPVTDSTSRVVGSGVEYQTITTTTSFHFEKRPSIQLRFADVTRIETRVVSQRDNHVVSQVDLLSNAGSKLDEFLIGDRRNGDVKVLSALLALCQNIK